MTSNVFLASFRYIKINQSLCGCRGVATGSLDCTQLNPQGTAENHDRCTDTHSLTHTYTLSCTPLHASVLPCLLKLCLFYCLARTFERRFRCRVASSLGEPQQRALHRIRANMWPSLSRHVAFKSVLRPATNQGDMLPPVTSCQTNSDKMYAHADEATPARWVPTKG
jgi:hypothetical protein